MQFNSPLDQSQEQRRARRTQKAKLLHQKLIEHLQNSELPQTGTVSPLVAEIISVLSEQRGQGQQSLIANVRLTVDLLAQGDTQESGLAVPIVRALTMPTIMALPYLRARLEANTREMLAPEASWNALRTVIQTLLNESFMQSAHTELMGRLRQAGQNANLVEEILEALDFDTQDHPQEWNRAADQRINQAFSRYLQYFPPLPVPLHIARNSKIYWPEPIQDFDYHIRCRPDLTDVSDKTRIAQLGEVWIERVQRQPYVRLQTPIGNMADFDDEDEEPPYEILANEEEVPTIEGREDHTTKFERGNAAHDAMTDKTEDQEPNFDAWLNAWSEKDSAIFEEWDMRWKEIFKDTLAEMVKEQDNATSKSRESQNADKEKKKVRKQKKEK